MTRRLITILVALLVAPALFAAEPTRQQSTLLTPSGTLYTLESDFSFVYGVKSPAQRILKLITQEEGATTEEFMPFSLEGGWHALPSVAYDEQTDTLFAFWEHSRSLVSSELLIASYHDGVWTRPVSINETSYRLRKNFKIATSRFSEATDEDGVPYRVPSLIVHAIYWEQSWDEESAHYAMISFRDGRVSNIEQRPLIGWALSQGSPLPMALEADYDLEIFRHPSITEATDGLSVDVIFGDINRSRFHRVTIRPIRGNGVLDVPDGIWRGEIGTPRHDVAIAGIPTRMLVNGSTVAFYTRTDGELRYQLHRNGQWQSVRAITATPSISTGTAFEALNKLVMTEPR